jgi:RNA-directed DNA polymerase
MRAKLRALKRELKRRMHEPIPQQGRWLGQVVRGYFVYHAVPTNYRRLAAFRFHVTELWWRTLRRRSQKDWTTWDRITRLAAAYLPLPRILHPWPQHPLCRQTPQVGARCANRARRDLCGGRSVMSVPTAIQTANFHFH